LSTKADISIVGTSELAGIFGKTPRWVNQQTNEGVLQQHERGKYELAKNVQLYIAHIQDRAEKAVQGGDGSVDYFTERAHHEKAKREKAEMELAVMRGDLHRSENVRAVMNDMLAAFRARTLGLPSKVAPQLVGATELPVIQEVLSREVHAVLTELSEYDPAEFQRNNEEYVGQVDDDEEA
jgi:phage terminase Nu1 subunit (DNA packaging protein)